MIVMVIGGRKKSFIHLFVYWKISQRHWEFSIQIVSKIFHIMTFDSIWDWIFSLWVLLNKWWLNKWMMLKVRVVFNKGKSVAVLKAPQFSKWNDKRAHKKSVYKRNKAIITLPRSPTKFHLPKKPINLPAVLTNVSKFQSCLFPNIQINFIDSQ